MTDNTVCHHWKDIKMLSQTKTNFPDWTIVWRANGHHTKDENPGKGARDPAELLITICPEFKLMP